MSSLILCTRLSEGVVGVRPFSVIVEGTVDLIEVGVSKALLKVFDVGVQGEGIAMVDWRIDSSSEMTAAVSSKNVCLCFTSPL